MATPTVYKTAQNTFASQTAGLLKPVFASVFLVNILGGTAAADVKVHAPLVKAYSDETTLPYAANDTAFRSAYPMRVFIQTNSGRRSREGAERRGTPRKNQLKMQQQQTLMHQLGYLLPDYIEHATSADQADLVIRIRRTNYALDFRVIDVDQKNKKYKKSRRFVGGRCGVFHKAYYTKVKEKGEAYATYNLNVRLKGISKDRDQFTLRSAKNYSYGTNLRAATNCGTKATGHMPSNGVAKLFRKATADYRHHIASDIQGRAAKDLSRQIAHRVRTQADYFYTDLAARLIYRDQQHRPREHDHSSNSLHFSSHRPYYDDYQRYIKLVLRFGR